MQSRPPRLNLVIAAAIFALSFNRSAFAYGLFLNLESRSNPGTVNRYAKGSLGYAAVFRHEINYCVEIDASLQDRYTKDVVQDETVLAIKSWLRPVGRELAAVTINAVNCDNPKLDLRMELVSSNIVSQNGEGFVAGKTSYEINEAKAYTLIRVQGNFDYHYTGKITTSLEQLVPKPYTLESVVRQASGTKLDMAQFAALLGTDALSIEIATYTTILHEIGHGFGLCDNTSLYFQYCDPNLSLPKTAAEQPVSVMNFVDVPVYYYPSDDDVAGLQTVMKFYRRFLPAHTRTLR